MIPTGMPGWGCKGGCPNIPGSAARRAVPDLFLLGIEFRMAAPGFPAEGAWRLAGYLAEPDAETLKGRLEPLIPLKALFGQKKDQNSANDLNSSSTPSKFDSLDHPLQQALDGLNKEGRKEIRSKPCSCIPAFLI